MGFLKKQRWLFNDGEKEYNISISVKPFSFGKMKMTINERKYILRPKSPFSISRKRDEAFMLGENRGMLKVSARGKACLVVNGEQIPKVGRRSKKKG